MEISHDKPDIEFLSDRCKDCDECVRVCPVGAIGKNGTINKFLCRDYMFESLKGLRCGLCLKACPIDRR